MKKMILIYIFCFILVGCNRYSNILYEDKELSESENLYSYEENKTNDEIKNDDSLDNPPIISENESISENDAKKEHDQDTDETILNPDDLFIAFCKGEINAYEILEDGSFENININNYQLAGSISENEIIDMTIYLKIIEPTDLDNDGECEYLLYNPVYGYMCFDCNDGKVICFAHGEGTTAVCSYTWYNEECWIVHSDTTHAGRCIYKLSKYNGNLDIVASFEIGWTDWDGDGNASYYMDDMELTKEQYEDYINEIF